MPNQDQSFRDSKFMTTVRGQLLVAGGSGFDFTQAEMIQALEKQSNIILAAHNAELLAVLEGLKDGAVMMDYLDADGNPTVRMRGVRLADLNKAIAKVKEGMK